jgi:hypothetical protein
MRDEQKRRHSASEAIPTDVADLAAVAFAAAIDESLVARAPRES